MLACPSQKPDGFAERVVYELREQAGGDIQQSLQYFRRPTDDRLSIDELPTAFTLPECKKRFKTYFGQRFQLHDTDFESFLHTGLPKLRYDYVTSCFRINAADWDDAELMEDYLGWIMDSFAQAAPGTPTFLFFIVVVVKNVHQPGKITKEDQKAIDSLTRLVAKNAEKATLIQNLEPALFDDVEYWLDKISNGAVKQGHLEGIKGELLHGMMDDEINQWTENKRLDMNRIQEFQERVYWAHKKA